MSQPQETRTIVKNAFLVHALILSTLAGMLIQNENLVATVLVPTDILPILNLLLIVFPSFMICSIASKAYLLNKAVAILLIGNGFLFSGLGSLLAAWLLELTNSPNVLVTIHNSGILFSSFCFMLSSWLLTNRYSYTYTHPKRLLLFTYLGSFLIMGCVAFAAAVGITPVFFIQGQGPTPIRQLVLILGIFLYCHSCLVLFTIYYRTRKPLFLWYFLSLLLIAFGLLLIFLQFSVGSIFNLLGRFFQYLGHMYALVVILIVLKQTKNYPSAPEQALTDFFIEAKENYESLVEVAITPIVSIDHHNRILIWNSSAELLFGLSKNEAIGERFHKAGIFHDWSVWQNTFEEKSVQKRFTAEITNHQGLNFQVDVCMSARKSFTGWICTYIIRDITEQRRYEAEMMRLGGLDLVGQMAATIGHEVRNPLTVVRGYLQRFSQKDPAHQEQYELLIDELDRANSIISAYLSLAKNKSTHKELHDLSNIVLKMKHLMEANALEHGQNIQVEVGLVPRMLLDEREIRQLIMNLIRNAIEASPPNSTIYITIARDSNDVLLTIRDNGPGIPAKLIGRLGTPFLTTKPDGTGLGLSVCYRIAERHRATINVNSDADGTSFIIRFPGPDNR